MKTKTIYSAVGSKLIGSKSAMALLIASPLLSLGVIAQAAPGDLQCVVDRTEYRFDERGEPRNTNAIAQSVLRLNLLNGRTEASSGMPGSSSQSIFAGTGFQITARPSSLNHRSATDEWSLLAQSLIPSRNIRPELASVGPRSQSTRFAVPPFGTTTIPMNFTSIAEASECSFNLRGLAQASADYVQMYVTANVTPEFPQTLTRRQSPFESYQAQLNRLLLAASLWRLESAGANSNFQRSYTRERLARDRTADFETAHRGLESLLNQYLRSRSASEQRSLRAQVNSLQRQLRDLRSIFTGATNNRDARSLQTAQSYLMQFEGLEQMVAHMMSRTDRPHTILIDRGNLMSRTNPTLSLIVNNEDSGSLPADLLGPQEGHCHYIEMRLHDCTIEGGQAPVETPQGHDAGSTDDAGDAGAGVDGSVDPTQAMDASL